MITVRKLAEKFLYMCYLAGYGTHRSIINDIRWRLWGLILMGWGLGAAMMIITVVILKNNP